MNYSFSGSYTFNKPYAEIVGALWDVTNGSIETVVLSYSYTNNDFTSAGTTFTLGGTNGQLNASSSNLTGTLIAGHKYVSILGSLIEAYPDADLGGATATGSMTLALSDSPFGTAVPLPSTALVGLVLLSGVGAVYGVRRKHLAVA